MIRFLQHRLLQVKLRKSAIKYLFGNKMLTENTVKRIDDLVAKIKALMLFEVKHKFKVSLDRVDNLNLIVLGLSNYKDGTSKGFDFYEKYKIEDLIKNLISEK